MAGKAEGRAGGRQKSSQHLFSQGFVRASLNMDGVWSRAGASGTPQTAQAGQAGPSCCDGALLSFSPCLSLRLPPLLPRLTSLSSPFSLPPSFSSFSCLSSICQTKVRLFSPLVCPCLFPLLIFSILPLHILFLICYSSIHPRSFPSLLSLFSPSLS